jgi:glycosyltransferase involved in cell wall biosynthesis
MKIWYISKYSSPPNYCKAPPRLFYLAREARKAGNEVRLITSSSNHFSNIPKTGKLYNHEAHEGVEITWIDTKKYKKTASLERILSWLDFEWKLFRMPISYDTKIDVVVVSSLSILTILYGFYLKKRFKAFLVFEIRDIWPLTLIEEGGFSKWHPLSILIGAIEKFGYRKADLIVGTMPKLELHVKKRINICKPVFCSPLGFDSDSDSYMDKDLSINNPFNNLVSDNKVTIGYAGSMGISNALDTFIETIKLMKYNSNIHFLLVGSGEFKEKFQNELINMENVTFLSRIEHDKVKYFLHKCDILFLSTKPCKIWEYGQSMNKIVEYMLAGKVILASYMGYQSMINEAGCGEFINSTNPKELKSVFLKYVNMSKEDRDAIGQKGLKWIHENRGYDKLSKDYLDKIIELRNLNS